MFQLELSWHGSSVDHALTYSRQKIEIGSQKPSRITRQKTCCASESNTSVPVVFANRSGFDVAIGVVMAWEEHKRSLSDLRNLHELQGKRLVAQVCQTRRFALYLRTGVDLMFQLESSWHGRSVDHVLAYSGRQIAVGSQKLSRITRQKTCCANDSNTSVRVVFANRSGFDVPIGVVMAWEERGSCLNIFLTKNRSRISETERGSGLNIFRTINRSRISETFTNYEAKDLLRKNLHELRAKRLVAQVSQTRRFALYLRTGVDLMFQLKSSWHGRSVNHVLTYSGRQIAVGSQKPSRIMRQKTCCASEGNTSVRVVFANRSGFDVPIGVFMAWEESGSCLKIFWNTNRGRMSETFTSYAAKDLLRKNLHELRGKRLVVQVSQTRQFALYLRTGVDLMFQLESPWDGRSLDHVLTYFGRQIVVGSQKPSRIMRQNTCCASESNTSVRVVFANRSGFDFPIGVVMAWEERRSILNIFRSTNHGRISETLTNYEAKDLLCK
ncbi:uncharacterized protein G2W53_007686 [Senna tora]|uniref:Uncharacterized protein n=1 Tax=Senna tora TaxID=362788 RepID=A0A835CEH0_9FABA|nr:uncharacterized protein G2W53_007686 [Senna tora]